MVEHAARGGDQEQVEELELVYPRHSCNFRAKIYASCAKGFAFQY